MATGNGMKKALVFGAQGQIGSYLVELLNEKGYAVCTERMEFGWNHYVDKEFDFYLRREEPDEVYNLVAKMYAPDSWKDPLGYVHINGMRVLGLLEAMQRVCPEAKFFQAGSAEVFEKPAVKQWEDSNRLPTNPYGLAKMFAMEAVRIYREHYGMFACTGIFFNAESPRRKDTFFAKKAAREAVRIKREMNENDGKFLPARFGILEARRDWGWAPEYAEVTWRMLQQPEPMDFVIGTGEAYTCREFVLECLKAAGIDEPEEHFNFYVKYEKVEKHLADCMRACPEKAKKYLGWSAQYQMKDVARMLVEAEMKAWAEKSKDGLIPTTK